MLYTFNGCHPAILIVFAIVSGYLFAIGIAKIPLSLRTIQYTTQMPVHIKLSIYVGSDPPSAQKRKTD